MVVRAKEPVEGPTSAEVERAVLFLRKPAHFLVDGLGRPAEDPVVDVQRQDQEVAAGVELEVHVVRDVLHRDQQWWRTTRSASSCHNAPLYCSPGMAL